MPRLGKFIAFEGGEGAGKSTQTQILSESLARLGVDVVKTREPGGTTGAESIRALLTAGPPERWSPVTEVLLHYAARREHIEKAVLPALARGAWVVSDRFADSTMAYQGYGQCVDRHLIQTVHTLVAEAIEPDLTLIIDLPPELGHERVRARA